MYPMLTIGEVVERTGVAASALRYYEELGLIWADRSDSGHRRYPRGVLRRVAFIVFAQRIGLGLEEIGRELGKLPSQGPPSREDWEALTATWRQRLEAKIAELEQLRRGLTECIGCGCLSIDRCQLANPRDRAGANGPGPRFWLGDPPTETPD